MVTTWPPWVVLGHGFADAGALPLSEPLLLIAAVVPVVAAAAVPPRRRDAATPLAAEPGQVAAMVLRVLAVLVLVAIVVPAALGSTDAAANPAPRLLFTVGWAGLLTTVMLVGPWWRHATPLRLAADDTQALPLPDRAGVWIAVAALVAFGLAEQALEPSGVVVLAVVAIYVVGGVGGTLRYGSAWLAAADPLEVASQLLGSLAPLGRDHGRLRLRSPRLGAAALHPAAGAAAFLGVLIGSNLFDAAEVGGPVGTRVLLYAVLAGVTAAAVSAAARPRWLTPAFVPAAAGHVGAHYLAPLLVETQVAVVLASDPLGLGWNLLGLTGREIVAEPIPPSLGLTVQLLLLVAGHALAMVVATDLAHMRLSPRRVAAALFGVRAVLLASLVAGVYLRFGGG